jgi:hypothetical protein
VSISPTSLFGQSLHSSALQAKLFPGRSNDYVARGSNGEPVILVSSNSGYTQRAPIELRNFLVEYAAPMEVYLESGVTQGSFIVLTANYNRPDLYEAFCTMVEAAISGLTTNPTALEVENTIKTLIELFRAAGSPAKKTVAGLWGELLIIDAFPDPAIAIRAWHVTPYDTHDFVFGTQAVEIKATEKTERIHEFSHSQLDTTDKTILIVSVLLRASSTGLSCLDIAAKILQRLATQQDRLKLMRIMHESLGDLIETASEFRFDYREAFNLVRQVRSNMLPQVVVPNNSGISNIRYSINLDACMPPIVLEELDIIHLSSSVK